MGNGESALLFWYTLSLTDEEDDSSEPVVAHSEGDTEERASSEHCNGGDDVDETLKFFGDGGHAWERKTWNREWNDPEPASNPEAR